MQLFFFNATRTVYFKRQPDETGESPTRFPQAGKGFEGVEKGSFVQRERNQTSLESGKGS